MDNKYWVDEKGQKYEIDQSWVQDRVPYPSCGNCALAGYCRFCVKYPVTYYK